MSNKRKKPGRPKADSPKRKESFTISQEADNAVKAAAKRLKVSRSQVVDRCLRCQLLKDCENGLNT